MPLPLGDADVALVETSSGAVGPADAIVVFGTSHWTPAEVAADLYRQGLSPVVVTTGGSARSRDGACEALLHRDLLVAGGVPATAIRCETASTSTYENALLVRPLLDELGGVRTVIAVVKWFHRRALVHLAEQVPGLERIYTAAYEPFNRQTRRGMTRATWEETTPRSVRRETAELRAMRRAGRDLLTRTDAGWVRSPTLGG
ncbi:YdcF family protein [Xylanimonas protaetiae]|uniref:YdcF family protein n=1 Tax=Xylanimonas protaetiae TaxID=2509457 RepID=A0A4P6F4V0_9MICO|nr:YdcF family protein [Xylanimonas protaetiae]QAY70960.1 YdcF family protein [Xylanimonas protaetiae]